MSRTENVLRNIRVSLILQTATALVAFLTRKVFVQMLSQEYLGLNGTFSNILSMLSLAELGIGEAITYSLYKPLAEHDNGQIAALMNLFRRAYRIIGLTVALLGILLTPFLPVLIRELPDIPHIYIIYLLFVLNTAVSYSFVYKQSLMIADQRQYITTIGHFLKYILLQLVQAIFLIITRNYFVYLGLQISATLLENLIFSYVANRLYPDIWASPPARLKQATKKEIIQNTKAMVIHKVGGAIVFGTDNLLISFFVGIVEVGIYSNYLLITNGLKSIYGRLFHALTASIGNLRVTEEPEKTIPVFWRVNFLGNWLYGFSSICLVVLFNPFIALWVGEKYLFSQEIVCLIALNFYVTGLRKAVSTFREAYGLYWYDRYKPIAESAINMVSSIILAVPLGISGILIGTFISTITTCFWIEPWVLFKYGLHAPVWPYFRDYAVNTFTTLLTAVLVWHICAVLPGTGITLFLEKLAVCAVLGNLGYLVIYYRRGELRYFLKMVRHKYQ